MLLKRVQQQPVLSFQGMSQLLASSRQYRETPGISKVQSTNFPNSRSVTFRACRAWNVKATRPSHRIRRLLTEPGHARVPWVALVVKYGE